MTDLNCVITKCRTTTTTKNKENKEQKKSVETHANVLREQSENRNTWYDQGEKEQRGKASRISFKPQEMNI